MFALLPHAEEIIRVDYLMSTGVRGIENLSLFPAATKYLAVGKRTFSISSYLSCSRQRSLGQRRRKSTKARILCEPGALRYRRKIPTYGETCLCISYSSSQAQVILSSPYGEHPIDKPLRRVMSNPEAAGRLAL